MRNLLGLSGLILAAMVFGGCSNQLQKDYADLQAQYNDLSQRNADMKEQLAASSLRESELLAQMDARGAQSAADRARAERAEAELLRRQATAVVEASSTTSDGWQETDRTARITVGSDVLFASGRATLTADGKKKVNELAAAIKKRYPGSTVLVYGHTDSDPIRRTQNLWKDNLDLSANRAMTVTRELIGQGVPAKSIETIAMGESNPVATNSNAAGKAKNRRVEIVVLKQ